MNVKATPFNSFAFVSMAALAISGGSLVACQLQPAFQAKEAPSLFTPKTQPSTYGVLTAKITGKHSGVAVIKLDSFRLNVSFDFEAHPDSYGVPGSEFLHGCSCNLRWFFSCLPIAASFPSKRSPFSIYP
ncbi:hypothetical protein [Acinetobacter baumannii]|uniref:hypothetical protein n=1 Tax=Acinetobacter baumannii TaxID=470 RepID=UPI002ADF1043|nr:hypothetical protein [Acinetobacter baumannii]